MKNNPHPEEEKKVKLPLNDELEVRDLIKPIVVRRIRIAQFAGLILLILGIGVFIWIQFIKPPSGKRLVGNMIDAVGGAEAWNGVHGGSFQRTHHLYDEKGKIIKEEHETFYFKNNPAGHQLMIKSYTEEGYPVVVGSDEKGYWALLNDKPVDPHAIAKKMEFMCHEDKCVPLCASEMALYRFALPFKLTDYGVKPTNAGTTTLNGEKVYILNVAFDPKVGHDRWVFYVDPQSKLTRKIEHYASEKGNEQPEEIFLSDYKKEGNIQISHSNKYYRSNGKILEEYLISNVQFNPNYTTDFFNRPQQLSMLNK